MEINVVSFFLSLGKNSDFLLTQTRHFLHISIKHGIEQNVMQMYEMCSKFCISYIISIVGHPNAPFVVAIMHTPLTLTSDIP